MRVLLVDNLLRPVPDPARFLPVEEQDLDRQPHLGLLALAAVAERAGHTVAIFSPALAIRRGQVVCDETVYRECARLLLAEEPDVVGFTTLACSMVFTLRTARLLKRERPALPILCGGPQASIVHRQLLERYREIDVVVRHEADETFVPVLERLAGPGRPGFEGIPGVSWRGPLGVRCADGAPTVKDLDGLLLGAYHLHPIAELGLEGLPVEAGRGCPFRCTFCSTATFFGRAYRVKSAEHLTHELDLLHERYGVRDFALEHDLFTVNRRKVLAFCEAVKGRGYSWHCSARVDCVDDELLEAMAAAGCTHIYFGIETGSPRMQKVVKKDLDLALVPPVIEAVGRHGMSATTSFIVGYPQEEIEDLDATLDALGRLAEHDHVQPQLHMLTPEPGTELLGAFGAELLYDGHATSFVHTAADAEDEALVRTDPEVFIAYHHYPTRIPRATLEFAVRSESRLRGIGSVARRYTSACFGGSWARFARELERWASDRGRLSDPVTPLVFDFLSHRFGAGHHLVSLFRYALGRVEARIRGKSAEPAASAAGLPFDVDRAYALSRRAELLREYHDCTAILRRLREAPWSGPLDEAAVGPRAPHVLLDVDGPTYLEDFEVTPATFELLSRLRAPCTYRELVRDAPRLAPARSFYVELVELGILVPAQAAAPRRPTGATGSSAGAAPASEAIA